MLWCRVNMNLLLSIDEIIIDNVLTGQLTSQNVYSRQVRTTCGNIAEQSQCLDLITEALFKSLIESMCVRYMRCKMDNT